MIPTRLTICTAALMLFAVASATAEPAYVTSTVNLRSAAGTGNEIVAKIPGGSLVDATNCTDWCEVTWQDKKGFAIATSLDRSGRVPGPRVAARRGAPGPGGYVEDDDYVPVAPPLVYGAPGPYYYGYGYGYGYRPYYGYARWGYGYGYRGGRRHW
jgi:hypothetical protein